MNQEMSVSEIIHMIVEHHMSHPDHGIDCACMDEWIRRIRLATKCKDHALQMRIDYVFRSAISR